MINEIARQRFAKANGWSFTRNAFTLDALMRGMYSGGMPDRRLFDFLDCHHNNPFDHRESFRLPKSQGGRPVAILAHNYDGPDGTDARGVRALIAKMDGQLMLHIPPAGRDASWYFPGATLPMLVTRPGQPVVWPTDDEMAEFAATYQRAREARHPEAAAIECNPWD
jgi:hypothetical protein